MKKTTENNSESKQLTKAELTLICDARNGTITKVDIDSTCWEHNLKHNFIDGIFESNEYDNLASKYNVNIEKLASKIDSYNYKEFLEMLIQIDIFWGNDEASYSRFGYSSPNSIMKSISEIFNSDSKLADVPFGIKFRIISETLLERTHLMPINNMIAVANLDGEIKWFHEDTIIIID